MRDLVLSVAMLAAIALAVGGFIAWRRRGERRNGILMIVTAFVILANVAIWSLPDPVPADRAARN